MRSSVLLSAALGSATTSALATIEAVGSKFFTSDGDQFYIKGVAYQLVPTDPLIDTEQCQRDASLMQELGANAIRVYHVDPTADHDGCMQAFADAGIYAMVDMDTFSTYILAEDLYWNQTQLDHYAAVMDTFQGYDNLLGLFVGNEIITSNGQSLAAPFIKAAARDLKAYRSSKGYREIPIGYSAADIAELRPMLQDYLTCGGNASENIDFFGLNSYEWCDPATYATSGYANLEDDAANFPVPIFFSETGCNVPGPRTFEDQAAIFGSEMVNDWSGAIIYEWIQEANNYGLISYGPTVAATVVGTNIDGGYSRAGTPTPVSPDFSNLKSQWAAATPTGVAKSDYDTSSVSTRSCPASTASGWLVDGNVALPTVGETFSGTAYSTVPSATGTAAAAAATTSSTKNAVSGTKELTGMAAGLAGVMMIFAFWL
ncbi:Glucanosyltransferase-domain-containing protein [Pestalotiopsis sp. NC0098]|nr:Glucanosyltransferase-domain-containing protein [Pestalotiopsis sp. NC0098]